MQCIQQVMKSCLHFTCSFLVNVTANIQGGCRCDFLSSLHSSTWIFLVILFLIALAKCYEEAKQSWKSNNLLHFKNSSIGEQHFLSLDLSNNNPKQVILICVLYIYLQCLLLIIPGTVVFWLI